MSEDLPGQKRAMHAIRVSFPVIGLLLCAALSGCGGSSRPGGPSAPITYDAFSNPTQVTITGYAGDAMEPFISKDDQYLFFNNRNDPSVDTNLYYASRVDDQTFTLLGPIPGANSPQLDAVGSLDTLGNLYFIRRALLYFHKLVNGAFVIQYIRR